MHCAPTHLSQALILVMIEQLKAITYKLILNCSPEPSFQTRFQLLKPYILLQHQQAIFYLSPIDQQ
jgi:hypothetical protein